MNIVVTVTIELSDQLVDQILTGIMHNFPEASSGSALECVGWKYDDWKWTFVDSEDDKKYVLTKDKLIAALPLIFTTKWPKGCTQPPANSDPEAWSDWLCQCDATDHDAFAQLACFGEVIYG